MSKREPGNQKVQLLKAMLRYAAENSGNLATASVDRLSQISGIDRHDVVKVSWALQKQGLLRFKESKPSSHASSSLHGFKLTDEERVRQMVQIVELPKDEAARVRQNGAVADVPRETPKPAAPAVTKPSPLANIDAEVVARTTERLKESFGVSLRISAEEFPEIRNLTKREASVTSAAETLKGAGLDDLADLVLAEISEISALEDEVMRLVKKLEVTFEEDQNDG